jgi:hypothetical protein
MFYQIQDLLVRGEALPEGEAGAKSTRQPRLSLARRGVYLLGAQKLGDAVDWNIGVTCV